MYWFLSSPTAVAQWSLAVAITRRACVQTSCVLVCSFCFFLVANLFCRHTFCRTKCCLNENAQTHSTSDWSFPPPECSKIMHFKKCQIVLDSYQQHIAVSFAQVCFVCAIRGSYSSLEKKVVHAVKWGFDVELTNPLDPQTVGEIAFRCCIEIIWSNNVLNSRLWSLLRLSVRTRVQEVPIKVQCNQTELQIFRGQRRNGETGEQKPQHDKICRFPAFASFLHGI